MSDVLIPIPDSLLSRLKRLTNPTGKDVEEMLGHVIAESVPSIPDGLSEEIRKELEALESLPDEKLREVALSFVSAEEIPEYSSKMDQSDLTMIKKAYANVILKWRGNPVSEEDLKAACQLT